MESVFKRLSLFETITRDYCQYTTVLVHPLVVLWVGRYLYNSSGSMTRLRDIPDHRKSSPVLPATRDLLRL